MSILGQKAIIRRRYNGAVDWEASADGRPTLGATTDTNGLGTIQPPKGDVLEMLDLGERASSARRVLTTMELRTTSQHTEIPADRVVVGSVVYEVVHVDEWDAVLPHYEATIVRERETA